MSARLQPTRPKIIVTADGAGVVSHAESRLLADVAVRTTLSGELSQFLEAWRPARARHDLDRVLVDLAVAVADGATAISWQKSCFAAALIIWRCKWPQSNARTGVLGIGGLPANRDEIQKGGGHQSRTLGSRAPCGCYVLN